MPAGLVLAAALLIGAPPADVRRPDLATYEVLETTRTVSPAGERNGGSAGTILVSGPRARWELAHGTFPRSSAGVVLADGGGVTLLDTRERLSASAALDDFTALFRGRIGPEGPSASTVRDLAVKVEPRGAGRAFEGRPTARWTLEAAWTLVVSTPGRIARVATEVKGTVEALDEPAARSAFDALSRILPARGAAAEALDLELAKITGVPVSASFDVVSKSTVEQPGMPSGTEPPPKPVEARQTITRRLTHLSVRKGEPADDALFAVPDGFHTRGLERLVPESPP